MRNTETVPLYSPELLALAVELAGFPFDPDAANVGYARSQTCGSEVWTSCATDREGQIVDLGLKVKACAVGQASAALFAQFAAGAGQAEIADMSRNISGWIRGDVSDTVLPRLQLLEGARPHAGRHEAILLPWRAGLDALSKASAAR